MDDSEITVPQNVQVAGPPQVVHSWAEEERRREEESLINRVGEVASRVMEELRQEAVSRARGFLLGRKEDIAEELHKTAEVFRESSRRFQEKEQGVTAKYVEQVAAQADRISHYLKDRELEEMADEMENMARKNPVTFLVGAFATGFIVSRFLRSPAERPPAS